MSISISEFTDEYGQPLASGFGAYAYVGEMARFVALDDGCALEVKNSSGDWIRQDEWTEA